jgi:hypothetical protein
MMHYLHVGEVDLEQEADKEGSSEPNRHACASLGSKTSGGCGVVEKEAAGLSSSPFDDGSESRAPVALNQHRSWV